MQLGVLVAYTAEIAFMSFMRSLEYACRQSIKSEQDEYTLESAGVECWFLLSVRGTYMIHG